MLPSITRSFDSFDHVWSGCGGGGPIRSASQMRSSRDIPLDNCTSSILMRNLLQRIFPTSSPKFVAASIWLELLFDDTSVERPAAHRHASSSESGVVKSKVRSARWIEKLRQGGGASGWSRGLAATLPPSTDVDDAAVARPHCRAKTAVSRPKVTFWMSEILEMRTHQQRNARQSENESF